MKKTIVKLVIPILVMCSSPILKAQVKPRLAGLETNTEYMALLEQEEQLRVKEDSLTNAVSNTRERLRNSPENREVFTKEIIRLEGEIFDIRNSIGIIASKINAIEQEYVINNLMTKPDGSNDQNIISQIRSNIPPENSSVLVMNEYFRLNVPDDDLAKLLEAQENEVKVLDMVKEYKERYDHMAAIAKEYEAIEEAHQADSLYSIYDNLAELNAHINETVEKMWGDIFDNKTFVYNLIFDHARRSDLLSFFDRKQREARETVVLEQNKHMSEVIFEYTIQKRLIFDYEKTIAEFLKYNKSLDSLSKAEAEFNKLDLFCPDMNVEEKLFLDYEDASIHSPSKYNSRNPIPELVVYDKGVIYRILVGIFQRVQPVSVMRGAYPVGYLKGEDGRYSYYVGGYRTLEEAIAGVDKLKKAGFRNPQVAVWDYSTYKLLDSETLDRMTKSIYRIEIESNSLPKFVREIMDDEFPGKEITRSGNSFFIGTFDDEEDAQELIDMLREKDENLKAKISSAGM